jgi:3-isopropylmalate/(R)-2-methylmalate dehydratase small subunit
MEAFVVHQGTAVSLRQSSVDTDQIIPARYLKRISRTGFADGLFAEWRRDPDFVLNRAEHQGASVLVTGTDFGIGSSREHAVWALLDAGFRVVVSPRFGDIFRTNAGKSGLLAAQVDGSDVEALWDAVEADSNLQVSVDLRDRTITGTGGFSAPFVIDDYTQWRLLEGLDDVAVTLSHDDEIATYEADRLPYRPVTLPSRAN